MADNKIPQKLRGMIEPANLTYADCSDLMTIAANAIQQCLSQQYDSMDIRTACEWSKCLQDGFTGINETDRFIETALTPNEWVELSMFAGDCFTLAERFWEDIAS